MVDLNRKTRGEEKKAEPVMSRRVNMQKTPQKISLISCPRNPTQISQWRDIVRNIFLETDRWNDTDLLFIYPEPSY